MNVKLETANRVATITLDRAEKMNALSEEMYVELARMFAELQADDSVRAVVITGAGKAFCSGSDVGRMPACCRLRKRTNGVS